MSSRETANRANYGEIMAEHHDHQHHEHENYDKLIIEVGAFSEKALLNAKSLVKIGASLKEVAEKSEKFVKDAGFGLAFPINLSINDQAAHYTPSIDDGKVFTNNDLVKVDFGVSKEGVLGDCACTVDLSGKHTKLVEASEEALKNAISTIKAGVRVSEIGRIIEGTILDKGFKPIKNLGGHGVREHDLHSSPFIPNYDNRDETLLEEGEVIAIEPFAVSGRRELIFESDICEIFEFAGQEASVRSSNARAVQNEIIKNYPSEPFASRWIPHGLEITRFNLQVALSELTRAGSLVQHPVLMAFDNGLVSQAEAQVLVTKDSCEVLTK